jgi:hypothetical protein
MPVSPTTVKVTYLDGSVETYDITDASTIVDTDGKYSFTGKLHGSSDTAHTIQITRSSTKKIEIS